MKRLNLTTLLLAAALFSGIGATSLSACSSCGCNGKKATEKPACKSEQKAKGCDCNHNKAAAPQSQGAMKCGNGKCGTGKCGSK